MSDEQYSSAIHLEKIIASNEEERENKIKQRHNSQTSNVEDILPYSNEKFIAMVDYTSKLLQEVFNPHLLKGFTAYLSGAIEFARDDGIGWRKLLPSMLRNAEVYLNLIDPTDKGPNSIQPEIGEERRKLRELKASGEYGEVRRIMKLVRRWDLRAVDHSNFVIVAIDPKVPTWGTPDEIVMAERQKKPVFAVVDGGPSAAPDWVFAIIRPDEMFDSFPSLVNHLSKIDKGEIAMDDRWIKMDQSIHRVAPLSV